MLEYSFMQNALLGGVIIALVCGFVSVFVILRRTSFAAHALGHMSLTGAAGAALLGIPSILGQIILNVVASVAMGLMGDKVKKNDLAIGVVLTFVLGFGIYFLFLFQNNYAGSVMGILFGNIFAVSHTQLIQLAILGSVILITLLFILRPLVFVSIDPVVAESKNIPVRLISVIFFVVLAVTVSMACQIVGVMLVFTLLIIPGAIGNQWGQSIMQSLVISMMSAVSSVIIALFVSYNLDLPASFCITMVLCLMYFVGGIKNKLFVK